MSEQAEQSNPTAALQQAINNIDRAIAERQGRGGPIAHLLVLPGGLAPGSPWPRQQFSGGGPTTSDWYKRWHRDQVKLVPLQAWPIPSEPVAVTCDNENRGPIHAFWGTARPVTIAREVATFCAEAASALWLADPMRSTSRGLDWVIDLLYGVASAAGDVKYFTAVANAPVEIERDQVKANVLTWSSTPDLLATFRKHLGKMMEPPPAPPPRPVRLPGGRVLMPTAGTFGLASTEEASGASSRKTVDKAEAKQGVSTNAKDGEPLDGAATKPSPTKRAVMRKEKALPPSRANARAVYEWVMNTIEGAEKMTVAELFAAAKDQLDIKASEADGVEAERLDGLLRSLPDNAETFRKYLNDAGVKRYSNGAPMATRSVRRQSEI